VASAYGARTFAQLVLPAMGNLGSRLAAPGARMPDVGTGVGALAVAFARVFPQLHVLGIDVLDRPRELARQNIAASDVAAQVTVRKQDVAGFTDDTGFDLAWLPAPFVSRPAVQAGLPRVAAALDEAEASELLDGAGLTSVRPVPTPDGAPSITIGQKRA
jgi:methylase of polypeptide subunit release factors